MNDAVATSGTVCEHDEPRGCASCPLCRRYGCLHCRPLRRLDRPDGSHEVVPERNFTLRLPADLHEALKQRARAEDRRLAQTVRAAIRAYLGS